MLPPFRVRSTRALSGSDPELDRHGARWRDRPRQVQIDPPAVELHNPRRCPDDRRVGRNVVIDDEGVCADLGVIADPDRSEQDRVGPNEHVVTDQRVPLAVVLSGAARSEEHTSELQSHLNLVCRLLLEKKKKKIKQAQYKKQKTNNRTD